MVNVLKALAATLSEDNLYFEDKSLRLAQAELKELGPDANVDAVWALKYRIASTQFRLGQEEDAIASFEELQALMKNTEVGKRPGTRAKISFQLGVAYLRLAETQNCCQRYTTDSCVFPIRGQGIHQQQEASRAAIQHFTEALFAAAPNSAIYFSSLWLLNIAHMTVGTYPDEVPSEFLIPPSNLVSSVEFPRFQNISAKVGLGSVSLAGGVVADDFNGDGTIDFMVSDWHPAKNVRLFLNHDHREFTDTANESGLTGIVGGLNMIQADYDNDGRVDVLVLRGGWLENSGAHPNSLLQNLGQGHFQDVAFHAGLAGQDYPTQTAAWADYDNDGFLDLYVGNEATPELPAPCQLFHNNGNGTFTDVARSAGVTNDRYAKSVVWGDFDADDLPDLYVSNFGQPNRLYRNNGDGTFTDVAVKLGVETPISSFPAWFWDVDNDGDLDIFVSAYTADISDMARSYLGKPNRVEPARLYLNDGHGQFTDAAENMNLVRPNAPMGSNFGDLDNDGFLDFYLGTGYPYYHSLMPNVMYWNRGGSRFEDVTFAGGFGNLQKGHGVTFVDFDDDGDQDVFEQMGGALLGDSFVDALYENPGFGNAWIRVELIGKQSNRSAIGARLRITALENGKRRQIYRHVNSGGSFGANPLRQMIGLGKAEKVEELQVYWPASHTEQVFSDVSANRRYRIEEQSEHLEVVSGQSVE